MLTTGWGRQKPPLGAQLIRNHPLTRGLINYWLMNQGAGISVTDLAGTNPISLNSSASTSLVWANGLNEPVVSMSPNNSVSEGSSGLGFVPASPVIIVGGSDWSFLCSGYIDSFYTANPGLFRTGAGSMGSTFCISQANNYPWLRVNGSDIIKPSSGTSIPLGKVQIAYVFRSGISGSVYINGILAFTASTSAVTPADSISQFNSQTETRQNLFSRISTLNYYNRALSSSEIGQLYFNPYQIIASPIARQFYSVPGVAGLGFIDFSTAGMKCLPSGLENSRSTELSTSTSKTKTSGLENSRGTELSTSTFKTKTSGLDLLVTGVSYSDFSTAIMKAFASGLDGSRSTDFSSSTSKTKANGLESFRSTELSTSISKIKINGLDLLVTGVSYSDLSTAIMKAFASGLENSRSTELSTSISKISAFGLENSRGTELSTSTFKTKTSGLDLLVTGVSYSDFSTAIMKAFPAGVDRVRPTDASTSVSRAFINGSIDKVSFVDLFTCVVKISSTGTDSWRGTNRSQGLYVTIAGNIYAGSLGGYNVFLQIGLGYSVQNVSRIDWKQYQTNPMLILTLIDANGGPMNITGSSVVTLRLSQNRVTGLTILTETMTILNAAVGQVGYTFQAADVAVAGMCYLEIEETTVNGTYRYYPMAGTVQFMINPALGGP
jgi:hypothetical protein